MLEIGNEIKIKIYAMENSAWVIKYYHTVEVYVTISS